MDKTKIVRGRLPRLPDFRDHKFLASPRRAPSTLRHKAWTTGPVLDQGQTSQCVAFAGVGYLLASPIRNKSLTDTSWLYGQCRLHDEWPGHDYEGTSVRALFKVLKRDGFIERYHWSFDVRPVANWLLTTGPVVVGTIWPDAMFDVDRRGFASIGDGSGVGPHAAGHAYVLKAVNLDKRCPDGSVGAFRILNSWSRSYGQNGCAWISFADMAVLLREGGEACMAVERQAA